MVYCLYIISLIGFFFPRSKKAFWMEAISMTLFYGGYHGGIDLDNYIWQYENEWMTDWGFQKLYSAGNILFHSMGVSFEWYHMVLTGFSVLLLAIVIQKLSEEPAYVLSIVSLFVYVENGWQLKSMAAASFIVWALFWYFKKIFGQKRKLKNILLYILLIFIAMQFHYMAVFFLAFLVQPIIADHFSKIFAVDLGLFFLLPMALTQMSVFAKSLTNYLTPVSMASFGVTVLWHLVGAMIIYHADTQAKKRRETGKNFYLEGTKIMLLLLPFYYYANVAARLYRIWIIFMAIYISGKNKRRCYIEKDRFYFDIYIGGSYFFWFFVLFWLQGQEPIIFHVLKDNLFNSIL